MNADAWASNGGIGMNKSITLLTGLLLGTGAVTTVFGQTPVISGGDNQVNVIIINQPPFYGYGYRQQAPVSLPKRGSLFSTGQVGNYSAVPAPPPVGQDRTGLTGSRNLQGQPQSDNRRYDRVRSSLGTERRVIRLDDLERKVRRPASRRR